MHRQTKLTNSWIVHSYEQSKLDHVAKESCLYIYSLFGGGGNARSLVTLFRTINNLLRNHSSLLFMRLCADSFFISPVLSYYSIYTYKFFIFFSLLEENISNTNKRRTHLERKVEIIFSALHLLIVWLLVLSCALSTRFVLFFLPLLFLLLCFKFLRI